MEPVQPYSSEISSVSTQLKKPLQYLTSRYMALPSVPRELSNQKGTLSVQRHRPPRHRRGLPLVSRFLPTRELSNNRLTLQRTTSAKTRATATLRQRHIPPNVRVNSGLHNIQWVKCSNHNKEGGQASPLASESLPSRRNLAYNKT